MWGRKRAPEFHVDPEILEARRKQLAAERALAELEAQRPVVEDRGRRMTLRRLRNHFGEDIEVTFVPRGSHA